MTFDDARTRSLLRSAIAVAAACWVLVIASDWCMSGSDAPAVHLPHATAASTGHETAAIVEHPHIQDATTHHAPDLASAVLPRTATTLTALALVAAVVVATGVCIWRVLPVIRGPPRVQPATLAGQQLLTRLCIARR
ncbi:hypothetical protein [Mycobacterium hubeiense]|uniref:hypothetical protein n=1 Tax=Mycobacterium hubeiense TaxID=1867256 RepID=UPI000C7F755B|nr:hypothetical protein [Mycobacterium sp. QGD 101]